MNKLAIILITLLSVTYTAIVSQSSQIQTGDDIGPRWAPACQHVLHCENKPGRTLDIKVQFAKPFASVPKVILATRLLDYQGGGVGQGYFQELAEVTQTGFTIRFTAVSARQFYTNLVRYLATDDQKVHVQYFDTTDVGPIAAGDGERNKVYQIPIVGWQGSDLVAVPFTQGLSSVRGHTQIRLEVQNVQSNTINLKATVWWQTNLVRFRVGFLIVSTKNGFVSSQAQGDWGAAHFMVNGNGGRDVPAELPVTNPAFLADPKFLFGGFTGYLVWNAFERMANARIALNNIRLEGDKIKWVYSTWADSQTRIIDAQFVILKPTTGGPRTSDKGCAVIFSECQYGGDALEICDRSNNLSNDGFKGQVKSLYVPDGKVLTLFDQADLGGRKVAFSSSQECLAQALDFRLIQLN